MGEDYKVSSYKIVGIISSIFVILSMFIGGTMWISMNIANNTVAIKSLTDGQRRHEVLITKNAEIILQHARLLVLLESHSTKIDTLTTFMVKGPRFTAQDGMRHSERLKAIEEWITQAPPVWFREMFHEFKNAVNNRLDRMEANINSLRTQEITQ
jgi:hypothetical protein